MSIRKAIRASLAATCLVLVSILVLMTSMVPEARAAANVRVTDDPGLQEETTMALGRAGGSIEAGWTDQRPGWPGLVNCGFGHSSDGGVSWPLEGFLHGVTPAYDKCTDPSIAYSVKDDRFLYLGLAADTGLTKSAIVFASSPDGVTWPATPKFIASSASKSFQYDKDALAVDNVKTSPTYGRIYATWTFRNKDAGTKRIQVSFFDGTQWSVPQDVSSPFKVSGGPTVAVGGPAGTVYVAWCIQSGDAGCAGMQLASMIFTRSDTGGLNWSTPATAVWFTDVPPKPPSPDNPFRWNSFGTLSVNPVNGFVHLVWTAWNGADADVMYSRSTDAGLTWSTPVKVGSHGDDQFFPRVAVSADGSVVWVCYYDQGYNSFNGNDVSCNKHTSGTSFGSTERVTTETSPGSVSFIGDYIGMDAGASDYYVVWADFRNMTSRGKPEGDIYFGRDRLMFWGGGRGFTEKLT